MQPADDLGFVHKFVPAQAGTSHSATLLLLHGTGGDENDLLPLGRELWPDAAFLSPRGKVSENGMPRFFRRFAEGVFDINDLKFRTQELAQFIEAASARYGFSMENLVAVGYSNGANIAASLILLYPRLLRAAVLFRAMVPFMPKAIGDFSKVAVFIGAGLRDPTVPRDQPEQLAATLKGGGADVTLFWHQGGHELGTDDIDAAKAWLSEGKVRNRLMGQPRISQ